MIWKSAVPNLSPYALLSAITFYNWWKLSKGKLWKQKLPMKCLIKQQMNWSNNSQFSCAKPFSTFLLHWIGIQKIFHHNASQNKIVAKWHILANEFCTWIGSSQYFVHKMHAPNCTLQCAFFTLPGPHLSKVENYTSHLRLAQAAVNS